MTDSYLSLTVDVPESESELLQDLLHEEGALGLEVRDHDGPLMPGVRAPAKGEVIVVAWFGDAETAEAARKTLAESFPSSRATLEGVEGQDWSTAWRQHIRAVQVGRLWVGPPWSVAEAPPELERIVIEPKMAFGTGDHPTTSLCLAAVDAFMAAHPGASVLDVGTGTGVLAIAAKRLGAGRVVGTDNDPVSVELSQENAQANGTPDVVLSGSDLDAVSGTFDLVVANILANTLIELAPLLVAKVDKQLVLAGVLAPQAEDVTRAFVAQGLTPLPGAQQGEWVRLDFTRG
jgi:ribosomal protein L11 methyltransferase